MQTCLFLCLMTFVMTSILMWALEQDSVPVFWQAMIPFIWVVSAALGFVSFVIVGVRSINSPLRPTCPLH